MGLSQEQYTTLMRPLNATRIAKRSQGGKSLSYLEAWDVKAHLTRVFGFLNWDAEMLDYNFVGVRDYMSEPKSGEPKPMVEVIYSARMRLTVRTFGEEGKVDGGATFTEAAVGSASGPASMLGDHHDNALKTAASDALKRCAINLGTQFGLSLYDDGRTADVIKRTLVLPSGVTREPPTDKMTEAQERLQQSLGAQEIESSVGEPTPAGADSDQGEPA